ncbi:PilZ domain-containing protein [Novosphingobium sp. 9]|uniref:PilZ domain-containing protein n=1 Tax=Novosphingobium sp. 9 TaxID=2025349 RepID=UPI0021B6262A|nr:PilZ domain-containing protein [Novosphingobium sp. 9]
MEHVGGFDPVYPAEVAPSGAELRERPRFALLLRSAKLIGDQGEFLCIVRDVSESGVRLKLFNDLSRMTGLSLEMATGDLFALDMVWARDGEAGFRFLDPIDVQRFIGEGGPYPKRPIRLRLRHPARLMIAGEPHAAMIVDLSRQGAGVETQRHLAIGQRMRLEAEGLPPFDATVCWRRHPGYGLVFTQLMSLEELAERSARVQAMSFTEAP